jgi:hypothetical protein
MFEEDVSIVSNGKGIMFSKLGHVDIVGHTYSDFTGSKLDRKKQNVTSLSSVESKAVNCESQKLMVCSNCAML